MYLAPALLAGSGTDRGQGPKSKKTGFNVKDLKAEGVPHLEPVVSSPDFRGKVEAIFKHEGPSRKQKEVFTTMVEAGKGGLLPLFHVDNVMCGAAERIVMDGH